MVVVVVVGEGWGGGRGDGWVLFGVGGNKLVPHQ